MEINKRQGKSTSVRWFSLFGVLYCLFVFFVLFVICHPIFQLVCHFQERGGLFQQGGDLFQEGGLPSPPRDQHEAWKGSLARWQGLFISQFCQELYPKWMFFQFVFFFSTWKNCSRCLRTATLQAPELLRGTRSSASMESLWGWFCLFWSLFVLMFVCFDV